MGLICDLIPIDKRIFVVYTVKNRQNLAHIDIYDQIKKEYGRGHNGQARNKAVHGDSAFWKLGADWTAACAQLP